MVDNFNFYSLTLENQEDGSTTLELFINGISQGQNSFSFATPSYSYLEIGRNVVEQNEADRFGFKVWKLGEGK